MSTYFYARVSTTDQNLSRQLDAARRENIPEENIYCDKASGKNFSRVAYMRLTGTDGQPPVLQEGDLLIVLAIDRLGRDYTQIQAEWKRITQDIKANIRVLDMPLLDTRSGKDSLDGRFVADLVLQILAYVSAKERENTLARSRAGIEAARARGVYSPENHKGRVRQTVDADLFESCYKKCNWGAMTQKEAAALLGLKQEALSRRFAERRMLGAGYDPNKALSLQKAESRPA